MKKSVRIALTTVTIVATITVSGFFYYRHLQVESAEETVEILNDVDLRFDPDIWDINNK